MIPKQKGKERKSKPVQEEIATEDVLVIPEGPLTRARAKMLKEECLGQISNHEAFTLMEFSPTS
ncbi:hypothetical protein F2Q69_00035152 [Brassica cretica]|uniref:Uncharacterized protein n=2 Tax=Brassica TaxID=3705 RepID=A0A8S9SMI4_BRACR|nr:hypothetical protein F2Q69_00035152 [Brassica cretica]CAF2074751.1 unnamed protein product [Brassica napus]